MLLSWWRRSTAADTRLGKQISKGGIGPELRSQWLAPKKRCLNVIVGYDSLIAHIRTVCDFEDHSSAGTTQS
jgi:hypothetical protein